MINPSNVGEWMREVQERPESAPHIIREIAQRLIELDRLTEQLRAENLELSSGLKVHQYQARIAELEYQLEIISRQLDPQALANLDKVNLLLYNSSGQVIKLELSSAALSPGATLAKLSDQAGSAADTSRLLAISPTEELLFLFDSGRVTRSPVADLPLSQAKNLSWADAYRADLRSDQELIVILPIGTMASFDQAIQISRRGFGRKIVKSFLQKYVAQGNIGKGIDLANKTDKALNLTLCNQADAFVIVTRQGQVMRLPAESLPIAANQAIRLDPDDSVMTSFVLGSDQSLVVVTREGRAVRYPAGWLKPDTKPGGKGQAIWPRSKTTGVQVVGALAAGAGDWAAGLKQDGQLVAIKIADIPLSQSSRTEHTLKNIYPFDLVAFAAINL